MILILVCGGIFVVALLSTARFWRGVRRSVASPTRKKTSWPDEGMVALAEALPSPCFLVDSRGIIRSMNRAAFSFSGGAQCFEPLSLAVRQPKILSALEQVAAKERKPQERKDSEKPGFNGSLLSCQRVQWNVQSAGGEHCFEAVVAPVFPPHRKFLKSRPTEVLFLVLIKDLTEQYRALRWRTDFVTNASHELRTPLASLIGFIETLQGPARRDSERMDQFLAMMHEQSQRMVRLVEDLLSLSRLEMRSIPDSKDWIDLKEIVESVLKTLTPLATQAGCTVTAALPSGRVLIRGARDEMITLVENLIENAFKYGNKGEKVHVQLSQEALLLREGKMSQREILLSVRDWGEGIDPKERARLTERFYRGKRGQESGAKGTGLGLALVKHILNRHDGVLEIVSPPEGGALFVSRFTVSDSSCQERSKIKESSLCIASADERNCVDKEGSVC